MPYIKRISPFVKGFNSVLLRQSPPHRANRFIFVISGRAQHPGMACFIYFPHIIAMNAEGELVVISTPVPTVQFPFQIINAQNKSSQ